MPASFVVNGDGTITIKYEYTADAERVSNTIRDAAQYEYLVNDPRIPWVMDGTVRRPYENLNNQQKLNITFQRIKYLLLDEAKAQHIIEAVEAARQTAEGEDIHIPIGTQSA